MADEMGQIVQTELETGKMVIKGSVEVAQFVLRCISALCSASEKNSERLKSEALKVPGEKEGLDEIIALCEGGSPQGIDVRSVDFEEVARLATERGLHFWKAVDFNPNDNKTPLLVPYQESAALAQICAIVAERRLAADKATYNDYSDKMHEVSEMINNASPEQKKDLEIEYENLSNAKDDIDKWINDSENICNNPNSVVYDFNEYLRKAKGTDFESNPEVAMAEYTEGVECSAKVSCKECFQPIRSSSSVPDSSQYFYVPDNGVTITRNFSVDEKSKVVYSDYSFKSPNGELFSFSDRNITNAVWNEKVLPDLMVKAGVLEGTMCRVFDSNEKRRNYVQYHGNIENPAKKRIEKKLAEDGSVFSSAEAKSEILKAVSEQEKGIASAPINTQSIIITCPADAWRNVGGKLDMKLSETEHIQFSSMQSVAADVDSPGMYKLTFTEADNPTLFETKGDKTISFKMSLESARDKIQETLNYSAKIVSESTKVLRNKGR